MQSPPYNAVRILGATSHRSGRVLRPVFIVCFLWIGVSFIQENLQARELLLGTRDRSWNIETIVSALKEDTIESPMRGVTPLMPVYVGVIPDHHFINSQTIRYQAAVQKLSMTFVKVQTYRETALRDFQDDFARYGYIITKSRYSNDRLEFQDSTDRMHSFFESQMADFTPIGSFTMPDLSIVAVYARRSGAETGTAMYDID